MLETSQAFFDVIDYLFSLPFSTHPLRLLDALQLVHGIAGGLESGRARRVRIASCSFPWFTEIITCQTECV